VNEAKRIALNDALQQAYLQLDGVPGATNGCAQLKAAAEALITTGRTPKRALDPVVISGVAGFRDGADKCLAGDPAGARQSLAAAAQARADAENQLEEILEAPNGQVN
jgi:hypothetical protein